MAASNFLWFNESLHPAHAPLFTAQDRGVLLGDGLFETMRVHMGHIPLLSRHLARLEAGCRLLHITIPNQDHIQHAVRCLIEANALETGSARLTLTRGPGPRGLAPPPIATPSLLITTSPAPTTPPRPVTLHISTQRRDKTALIHSIKSLNALPAILARLEAQEHGADDALWLNHEGHVTEATAASFVGLIGGQLVTPPLTEGILPGISRARLLEAELCREQTLTLQDIPQLEGAWLLTALSLTPIERIGTATLPQPLEWTLKLRHALYDDDR